MFGELRKTANLKKAGYWAVLMMVYSSLTVWLSSLTTVPDLRSGLAAGFGFALALLISFRINRSYDRWWEARTQWGTLVNASRNLAVKVRAFGAGTEHLERSRLLLVSFCHALKNHLRDEPSLDVLRGVEPEAADSTHVPSFLARRLYELIELQREESLTAERHLMLDLEAKVLLEVCGACERIKNTPVSASWRSFTLQTIVLIMLLLPWSLVGDFEWWAVPIAGVVGYLVIAGEVIARSVEVPFGSGEDQLKLEDLCASIDESVSEILSTGWELSDE